MIKGLFIYIQLLQSMVFPSKAFLCKPCETASKVLEQRNYIFGTELKLFYHMHCISG